MLRTAAVTSDIIALTRNPSSSGAAATEGAVRWLALDLRDPDFARELPWRVDAIVHLAQSREYRDFPEGASDMFEVNLGATARLLDYARHAGVGRFVFASTATMYEPSHQPLTERSPLLCTSYYSASKRAAELLIQQYRGLFSCWLVRIFTVYGADQRDQLVANLIRRVEDDEAVTVQGSSGLPLSPIHVSDVARAVWYAASSPDAIPEPGGEVVNLGGSERMTIRSLAEEIGRAMDRAPRFAFSAGVDPPGFIADRTLLDRMLPDMPSMSFADGIRQVLAANGAATAR